MEAVPTLLKSGNPCRKVSVGDTNCHTHYIRSETGGCRSTELCTVRSTEGVRPFLPTKFGTASSNTGWTRMFNDALRRLSERLPANTCLCLKVLLKSVKREEQQDVSTIRCLLLTSVSTCFGHHYAHLLQLSDVFINFCLNMFRASLCPSSGEERPCYCILVYCSGSAGCGW